MKENKQPDRMEKWFVVTAEEFEAWLAQQDRSEWEQLK